MRKRTTVAVLAVTALALASVPAVAVAAKGGGGKGGGQGSAGGASASISLNDSDPALGDWITFSSSYPTSTKNPRIQVICYQNGDLVYGEAGSPDHSFQLGGASSDWLRDGGPARCNADLIDLYSTGQGQQVEWLDSTTFDAAG